MSNFMKGFSQGFQPYVGNIGSIISNIMMQSANRNQQYYSDQAKRDQGRYDEAQKQRMKAQAEAQELARGKQILAKLQEDPVKNAHLYALTTPEVRAQFNTWKGMQDQNEVREVINDEGRFLMQYTKDWQGNIKKEQVLEKKLAVVNTDSQTKDGKTLTYETLSDGSRRLKKTDTDYDKVSTYQKENQEFLKTLDKEIEDALFAKNKVGIYKKSADIKSIEDGNDKFNPPIPTDYKDRDIAQITYENKKNKVLFDMRDEVSDEAWDLIKGIEGDDPQRMREILNSNFSKWLESGELTQKDLIYIGKAYRLYTGETL